MDIDGVRGGLQLRMTKELDVLVDDIKSGLGSWASGGRPFLARDD